MLNQIWSGPISKRVVIAHGWADDPTKGWIAWLVRQLEAAGVQAAAPQFPDAKRPDIKAWLKLFGDQIGKTDEGLVLIGHSLGCLIVLKYLSELQSSTPIAGVVLVAGMKDTASWRPEGLYPIDFSKVTAMAERRICIYSDDDDKVEPAQTKELAGLIKAKLVLDAGKGHFAGLHGCAELPSVLTAVQACLS